MELNHVVLALSSLLHLTHPSLHHLCIVGQEVEGRGEGSRGNHSALVHDGLLEVALDLHEKPRVDDLAEDSDRV